MNTAHSSRFVPAQSGSSLAMPLVAFLSGICLAVFGVRFNLDILIIIGSLPLLLGFVCLAVELSIKLFSKGYLRVSQRIKRLRKQ